MSSKFSDIPYFIIENFLNTIRPYNYSLAKTGSLRGVSIFGSGINICARGGYGVNLYLKNPRPSSDSLGYNPYYRIKGVPYSLTSRNSENSLLESTLFTFQYVPATAIRGSEITLEDLIEYSSDPINTPIEIYFGIDRILHEFIENNDEYVKYVNTNKRYLYFGELFALDNNKIVIDYNNIYKYALNTLPVNNRTENLQIFLETFFDKQYSEIYNSLKNILCLSDPYEMWSNYLYYLLLMYNVSTKHSMDIDTERVFVANLPYYLKRKGTYSSLYIIWNTLAKGTTNLLNIYERWHNWEIEGTPLENFTDFLYTSFPHYNEVPPETGAGHGYYYSEIARSVIDINTPSLIWDVTHNLNNKYPLCQFVDDQDNIIIPSKIFYRDISLIEATFGEVVSGKAICTEAPLSAMEFIHIQNTPSITWNINHALGKQYPIIQVIYNDEQIIPDQIYYENTDDLTLTFSEAMEGVAVMIVDDDLTVTTHSSGTEWYIEHNLDDMYPLVQIVNNDYLEIPDGIKFNDTMSYTVTFTENAEGKAITFSNTSSMLYPTYSPEISGGCLTPHYRVEIDLSNEPLHSDAIIKKEFWDDLLSYWNEMRPVCKFAHYNEIISPITDFTGLTKSLYQLPTKYGYLYSQCCRSVAVSFPNSLIFNSVNNLSKWIIKHNFGTKDLNIQCFDANRKQIYPSTIEFTTNSSIVVTFSVAVNGYAFISVADYTHEQSVSSSEWEATHNFGDNYQYVLELAKYETQKVFIPQSVTMSSTVSASASLIEADTGFLSLTKHTMVVPYERSEASKEWYVYHGLNSNNIQVQAFDNNDNVIYPASITIVDNNVCILLFNEERSGIAVVREVGIGLLTMDEIISSISYLKIGNAGSRNWKPAVENDIESPIGTFNAVLYKEDGEYYYIRVDINDNQSYNISEMGIFSITGDILFYTYCSPIYKPENISLIIWYRIAKIM